MSGLQHINYEDSLFRRALQRREPVSPPSPVSLDSFLRPVNVGVQDSLELYRERMGMN